MKTISARVSDYHLNQVTAQQFITENFNNFFVITNYGTIKLFIENNELATFKHHILLNFVLENTSAGFIEGKPTTILIDNYVDTINDTYRIWTDIITDAEEVIHLGKNTLTTAGLEQYVGNLLETLDSNNSLKNKVNFINLPLSLRLTNDNKI